VRVMPAAGAWAAAICGLGRSPSALEKKAGKRSFFDANPAPVCYLECAFSPRPSTIHIPRRIVS
jgi:hypothetical protein